MRKCVRWRRYAYTALEDRVEQDQEVPNQPVQIRVAQDRTEGGPERRLQRHCVGQNRRPLAARGRRSGASGDLGVSRWER